MGPIEEFPADMTQQSNRIDQAADSQEPKLVASLTDARQHRHLYIYYRRNAFDAMLCVHRHFAAGRLTMDDVTALQRQISLACDTAG